MGVPELPWSLAWRGMIDMATRPKPEELPTQIPRAEFLKRVEAKRKELKNLVSTDGCEAIVKKECTTCARHAEFICSYCGVPSCRTHRLPENHECKALKEHNKRVSERGFLAGNMIPMPVPTSTVIKHEPAPFMELIKDVPPKPQPKERDRPLPYPKFEKKKGWLQRLLEKLLGDD
jgi:hypothetical protein